MGKKIIKEVVIFIAVVLILAAVQHNDLLTHPMDRVEAMLHMGNYVHPFLWAILPYLLLVALRFAIAFVLKSIGSKEN
ncbi:MAG: hypothetical protein ACQESH_03055 [Campylobacterota bacterium]